MRTSLQSLLLVASLLALGAISSSPAMAKCTRLAFSVNDYGKEGPAKDAKKLLDKYIADWTSKRSIKGYKTGPKSVSCKMFLNFIVFDEYTCRAEATVCWGGSTPSGAKPSVTTTAPKAPAGPSTGSTAAGGSTKPVASKPVQTEPVPSKPSIADSRYVTGE